MNARNHNANNKSINNNMPSNNDFNAVNSHIHQRRRERWKTKTWPEPDVCSTLLGRYSIPCNYQQLISNGSEWRYEVVCLCVGIGKATRWSTLKHPCDRVFHICLPMIAETIQRISVNETFLKMTSATRRIAEHGY